MVKTKRGLVGKINKCFQGEWYESGSVPINMPATWYDFEQLRQEILYWVDEYFNSTDIKRVKKNDTVVRVEW